MGMNLIKSMNVAASGMKAQSDRLRVVAENIANADSISQKPGGDPYRRKTITFKNTLDREMGVDLVKVSKYGTDKTDFQQKFDPGNPAADADGYVKYTNVNIATEMTDMREAQRGYEANLNVIEVSKSMITQTINMLR